jgi:hypothetical protein
MKSILIKLFIGAALVWSGDKLMVKERQFTTAEEVKKYEELCNALTPTTAILDDSYTQTTMKVMKVPVKMYNYTYTYKVNEQEYKGSYTVNTELNSQILMIWYH